MMNKKTRVSAYLPHELHKRLENVYIDRKRKNMKISMSDIINEALWIYTSDDIVPIIKELSPDGSVIAFEKIYDGGGAVYE